MFSHIMIGSNDIERAKRFYDEVLGVLGAQAGQRFEYDGLQRLSYRHDGNAFVVTEPINGEPATVGNGDTLGFTCSSQEQAQRFHDTAVAQGATSIEDEPGVRHTPMGDLFLAYVRDPDGHKLCAVYPLEPAA
ncbi:VOC family protein [Salinicola endophyticus]|uniref:VOC family protein n=1 Tax=Salinicola endophyticus TaxID=1949083 RepID=A0ABY8FHD1_9GAMM|nr:MULTISPECIES: VOC family protein [Salinicola]WFF42224.1 VOC family protein [Salinicola endophyticus]